MKKRKSIEQALKDGFKFHSFRSGGGLRVLTLSKKEESDKGYYGESCDFSEALRILSDDVKAGGRKYKDVYGPIETHYWTGSNGNVNDTIDYTVCSGYSIDGGFDKETNKIKISVYRPQIESRTPEVIVKQVSDTEKHIVWKILDGSYKDYVYVSQPNFYPSGNVGCNTEIVEIPSNNSHGYYDDYVTYEGFGDTFAEALSSLIGDFKQRKLTFEYEIIN